jgi:hypothetical protein
MTYRTRLKLRRAVSVAFAIAWCAAFPASFAAVWLFNLSVGDAIAVLAAPCGLTAVLGLLNDHL